MILNELKILMEDNQGKDLPVAARQILYLSQDSVPGAPVPHPAGAAGCKQKDVRRRTRSPHTG